MKIRHFLAISGILCLAATGTALSNNVKNTNQIGSDAWINQEIQILRGQAANIDTNVLRLSLKAFSHAYKLGLDQKEILTVIDYSQPSTSKRLWVFDLKNNKELMNTLVAHGKNSGGLYAHAFSNVNGSKETSIGVFITAEPYIGGHGIAIRMKGLDRGFNDNAYKRNVVFHGANYMTNSFVKNYGRSGLSWGCPAVAPDKIKPLVDMIKGNTLVFAYYPDQNWLKHSSYLV